jgi:cytochrome o ubiquinol oxidase subunit 1
MRHFDNPDLQIWFVIAAVGAGLIAIGIAASLVQFYVSYRKRDQLRDLTGDPWDARTLEWATASPPPDYNFAFTPVVHDLDAWADMKSRGHQRPVAGFRPIHKPKNTGTGVLLAMASASFGVAMIWYMWWLAIASLAAALAIAIVHSFNYHRDFHIPAEQVAATEQARSRLLEAAE